MARSQLTNLTTKGGKGSETSVSGDAHETREPEFHVSETGRKEEEQMRGIFQKPEAVSDA